jgi:hypothetical protein
VSVLDTTLNKWIFGATRVHIVGHITAGLTDSYHAAHPDPEMKAEIVESSLNMMTHGDTPEGK